jgi:transposase InsO family protein
MVGPARKREVVAHVCQCLEASERRACRTLGQARSSQRDRAKPKEDDARLTAAIRRIAVREPRAGYRGVRRHLVREGWDGCTGSGKRKDSGCRRRPARSAAWATRKTEHNACKPSGDGIEILDELVARRGVPEFIRSDNGPEFVANAVKDRIAEKGFKTLFIEPGSPWQNCYSESFNARFRDEFLNVESFASLLEAKVLGGEHRNKYNHRRPHFSLGDLTPVEFAAACLNPPGCSQAPSTSDEFRPHSRLPEPVNTPCASALEKSRLISSPDSKKPPSSKPNKLKHHYQLS